MTTNQERNLYDEVPYPDLCFAQTHPALLEMLGQLLGMSPASAEQCRVLEIGTASGGNILPMAAVLPNSTFVGIDNSIVQIDRANLVVRETGLTNITFQHMDIMDITPEFGLFDYIISHGIYSWVPPAVQDKLLDICKRNLAPQGIAYVSYNTYPGWHMLEIVRNQMLYRTRNITDNSEKVEVGQDWISFMAHAMSNHSNSSYASVFENYLAFRSMQTGNLEQSALVHEELETYNLPLYFHQFVERAEQHELQYLVEADFAMVMPNGLTNEVTDHLKTIVRSTVEMEQYYDFLHNRSFRRTLLCHADIKVDRRLSTRPVQNFYISSLAKLAEAKSEHAARGIETFLGADGSKFATDHPLTKAAFHHLIKAFPLRLRFDDLVQMVGSHLNTSQPSDSDPAILAANLLRAFSYSANLIEFHTFAPQITTVVSEYPLTTPLARFQTRHSVFVVNLNHLQVELNNFSRLVLANLDGTNNRAALLDFLVELAEAGKISVPNDDQAPETPDALRQSLGKLLDGALQELAALGLLIA